MELNELRKIAEQATPGPWEAKQTPIHTPSGEGGDYYVSCPTGVDVASTVGSSYEQEEPDALHIATFDPPTVLALLSRLEQAEQDRVKLRNRFDAMRRQRDGYRNQLRKTEQQIQRVRELAGKGTDALLRMNIRSDGLYLSQAILEALDGDGRG